MARKTAAKKAFPGLKGFSPSNVSRMRTFLVTYNSANENSAQAVPKSTVAKVAQPVRQVLGLTVAQCQRPYDFLSQPVTEFRLHPIALRDIAKPIRVAEWQTKLVQCLPEPLWSNPPTIEQIEAELGRVKGGAT